MRATGAEVMVGGFTYQKGLFEDHASRAAVFAEEVRPFMRHEAVDLGPVVFCAEMNTLPTAVRRWRDWRAIRPRSGACFRTPRCSWSACRRPSAGR